MKPHSISRRSFVRASLIASATAPLAAARAADAPAAGAPPPTARSAAEMPTGAIGSQQFSRLMIGGNLISGYSHARDLGYVGTLARRYNTEGKIRETLELAEQHGITAINTWVQDDNSCIQRHWKAGGRMKWISQARLDRTGGFDQIQRAIDEGATGVHLTGDTCETLLSRKDVDKIAKSVQFIRDRKRIAGVAAHDLQVVVECEKAGIDVDFYQKTWHSHEYFTAPRAGETQAVGPNDNSWCSDPQAVVDFMAKVKKPWIAFKILAAGAVHPRVAFPQAVNHGADFILVGMFDWQVAEDAALAVRVFRVARGASSKRTRPWYG
jgi:hypothetical protein